MTKIRAFIAVALPADVREYLNDFRYELAGAVPPGTVGWVRPNNIHLTLRFLGDTDESIIPHIATAMDRLIGTHVSFELNLGELGCFPNQRRPRVLWVGVGGQLGKLHSLYEKVEELLCRLGWEPESRTFHPHLTLGRARDSRRLASARLTWGKNLEPRAIPVAALHLIESKLESGGAVYVYRHTACFDEGSCCLTRRDPCGSVGQDLN